MRGVCRLALAVVGTALLWLPAVAQTSNSSSSPSKTSSAQNSSSQNKTGTSTKLSVADRHFLAEAAEGNKAEVELGQLAAQKGSSDEVKKFGQRMVDDHTKAGQQAQQLADQKGVKLPDKLSAKDQALKSQLEKLSGKQFDRAYMRNMVKDHTTDVNEFRREAKMARDPDVKSYAQTTLPTLQDHLKEAKQIAPKSTAGAGTKPTT